jgi:hypothetical protein
VRVVRRIQRRGAPISLLSIPDWVTARIENDDGSDPAGDWVVLTLSDSVSAPVAGEIVLSVQSDPGSPIRLPVEISQDRMP